MAQMIQSELKIKYYGEAMEGCAERRNAIVRTTEDLLAVAKRVGYPKVDLVVNQVADATTAMLDMIKTYQETLLGDAESIQKSLVASSALKAGMKRIVDNADIKAVEFEKVESDGLHEQYDAKVDGVQMTELLSTATRQRKEFIEFVAGLYSSYKADDTEQVLKTQGKRAEEVTNAFCVTINNLNEVFAELNLNIDKLQAELLSNASNVGAGVEMKAVKGLDEDVEI